MIAFIQGPVRLIRNDTIVLDVQGVGYEVYVSHPYNFKLGEDQFLYTYQHVREDAILLFGFVHEKDYEVFMRLINVKGIGPRTALNMLGACSGKEMIQAIEEDDVKRLKALPGIGAKTASQIVLDLKGKFVSAIEEKSVDTNPVWEEVKEALLSLGYKGNQLTGVKKELASQDISVDAMLRKALALLAKRNGV
ncbi:MAG: Holliday junction branch migration protein RuvA [Erysipelotrichaceae bacterium]|uniref:Holliday junction branch migration protein RuvA n=1 Tax=Faecalicoccus pleomorphus TaxID=1323 RepID=UPI00195FB0A6|nr:Holliday junction branch migration protein RuvA [Faecalicoccus pleomorphus]MBE6120957.1 Holliday junction branch migration protein RuvA [Erysipelotrichaceae bacterium]MBM6764925.1 Holliday junction branch migration protein RuvA [Faecalicoccus pleomorphus]